VAVIAEEVATKLQGLLLGEQCIFSRPFPLEELKVLGCGLDRVPLANGHEKKQIRYSVFHGPENR
jgi:hypothetical protein